MILIIKLPPVGFLRVLKEGRQTGDLVDFVQKVVQLTINRRQEDQLSRSVVQIGNNGRESSVASLMCSQFTSYENEILDTRKRAIGSKPLPTCTGRTIRRISRSAPKFYGTRTRTGASSATIGKLSARVTIPLEICSRGISANAGFVKSRFTSQIRQRL